MKKKSLIALMTVTFVIAVFGIVGPVSAGNPNAERAVFEADIVPASTADHTLDKGEVYIRDDGSYKIEIEGAEPDTTYRVFMVFGEPGSLIREQLGEILTDEEGEGKLEDFLCFDEDPIVDLPRIKLRSGGTVQFVSGFTPVQCNLPPSVPQF